MTEKTGLTAGELALAEQGEALLEAELKKNRTPDMIAAEIRAIDVQTQGIVLNAAIEKGRRLDEVKTMLPHGEWGLWLKRELNYSQSTAQNLMKIFREYGSSQQCLFGAEAKSETFGILTYSQALRLLAIPDEDEREKFIEEHDVQNMSTRELERALKERDEALARVKVSEKRADGLQFELDKTKVSAELTGKELEAAKKRAEEAKAEADEKNVRAFEAEKELKALKKDLETVTATKDIARKRADDLSATVTELRQQIVELESRPVEIAVEKVVDEEAVEKARAEAVAEMQARLDESETARSKAEEMLKAADATISEYETNMRELAAVAARQEPEQKKNDQNVAEFNVFYTAWQMDYQRMTEILDRIAMSDAEKAGKLQRAVAAAVDNMRTDNQQGECEE